MPIDEMPASPDAILGVQGADTEIDSDYPADPAILQDETIMSPGMRQNGKFYPELHCYWSFDINVPVGGIVSGFQMHLYATGLYVNTVIRLNGGWCKPQTGSNIWQDPAGVHEWALNSDAPLAQSNNGADNDLTVFHDDAPAFTDLSFNTRTNPGDWDVAEGTLSGYNATTGVIAQLQSYLAANESLRGHRTADHIPALFYLYSPFQIFDNTPRFQAVYTQNRGVLTWQPKLYIDWDFVQTEEITARSGVHPAITARAGAHPAIESRPGTSPAVTSKPGAKSTITARAGVQPGVKSRG